MSGAVLWGLQGIDVMRSTHPDEPSTEGRRHAEGDLQLLTLGGGREMRCQLGGAVLATSQCHPIGRLSSGFLEELPYGTAAGQSCQAAVPAGADKEAE